MDSFNILPTEIMWDIFIRLPVESVLNCRVVSKTWRNHIQDRSFRKMHASRHLNHNADSGKLSFLALATNMTQFHYFEYTENHETPIDKITRIRKLSPFEHNAILGSVNGLICLSDLISRFCISNPRTREYIVLPKRMGESGWYYNWVVFGYVPSTDQYKVVVVNELKKEPKYTEIMVYTMGSGYGWRNIGKFNRKFEYVGQEHGIFANGALHCKDGDILWVFDLAHENFRAESNYSSKYLKINNCNPKACTWKTLVDFKGQFCQVLPHSITLVSLRGLGEGARIFKKRKRRN